MGKSFQDYMYSWIQDFEVDFPQKVGLKMLSFADYNSFSWFIFTLSKDNWKFKCENVKFVGILQVLIFEFLKFRILEILNFHPW